MTHTNPGRGRDDNDKRTKESEWPTWTAEKMAVAKVLAQKHFELEDGLAQVFRVTGTAAVEAVPGEPIKLLEVNENTVPCGVMPLHFGPAPASGITYPSIIVDVTPDEFRRILAKELKLPDGWENWEELPKPLETTGAA